MPRLPIPRGDANSWGSLLNEFLSVEHNADGTQKTVPIAKGGTGATDAATARANLGITDSVSLPASWEVTDAGTITFPSGGYFESDETLSELWLRSPNNESSVDLYTEDNWAGISAFTDTGAGANFGGITADDTSTVVYGLSSNGSEAMYGVYGRTYNNGDEATFFIGDLSPTTGPQYRMDVSRSSNYIGGFLWLEGMSQPSLSFQYNEGGVSQLWTSQNPSGGAGASIGANGIDANNGTAAFSATGKISGTVVTSTLGNNGLSMGEVPADNPAPTTNTAVIYVRDNGAGKTQIVARFPTGAVQVIATEP